MTTKTTSKDSKSPSSTSSSKSHSQTNYVYITPDAKLKQEQLVAQCADEIAWVGICEPTENGSLIVTDILVPKQEVSGQSVDFDIEALHELIEKHPDLAPKMRYFGHSHVNMAAYFSNVDWGDMIVELRSSGMPWVVCHVENKRGETASLIEVFQIDGEPMRLSIDCKVVTCIPDEIIEWTSKQIKDQVTKKSYTTSFQTGSSSSGSTGKSGSHGTSTGKDVTKVKTVHGKDVTNIVYDRAKVKNVGKYTLYTKTHRTVFVEGKEVISEKIEDWEKKNSPKVLSQQELKELERRIAESRVGDSDPTQIVSAHESDSVRSRKERQRRLRNEVAVLSKMYATELIFIDEGYMIAIFESSDLQNILNVDYETYNDNDIKWYFADYSDGVVDVLSDEDEAYENMAREVLLGGGHFV